MCPDLCVCVCPQAGMMVSEYGVGPGTPTREAARLASAHASPAPPYSPYRAYHPSTVTLDVEGDIGDA